MTNTIKSYAQGFKKLSNEIEEVLHGKHVIYDDEGAATEVSREDALEDRLLFLSAHLHQASIELEEEITEDEKSNVVELAKVQLIHLNVDEDDEEIEDEYADEEYEKEVIKTFINNLKSLDLSEDILWDIAGTMNLNEAKQFSQDLIKAVESIEDAKRLNLPIN